MENKGSYIQPATEKDRQLISLFKNICDSVIILIN